MAAAKGGHSERLCSTRRRPRAMLWEGELNTVGSDSSEAQSMPPNHKVLKLVNIDQSVAYLIPFTALLGKVQNLTTSQLLSALCKRRLRRLLLQLVRLLQLLLLLLRGLQLRLGLRLRLRLTTNYQLLSTNC